MILFNVLDYMCVLGLCVYVCLGGAVHVTCRKHTACSFAPFPGSPQLHYSGLVPRVAPGGTSIRQLSVCKRPLWHWSESYSVLLVDASKFDFSFFSVLSSHCLLCTWSLIISFTLKWRQMGDHMPHEHYDRHSFSFILPPSQSLCL